MRNDNKKSVITFNVDALGRLSEDINICGTREDAYALGLFDLGKATGDQSLMWTYENVYVVIADATRQYTALLDFDGNGYHEDADGSDWYGNVTLIDGDKSLLLGYVEMGMFNVISGYNPFNTTEEKEDVQKIGIGEKQRLKDHVEVEFLGMVNVHSFDLLTGEHSLQIAQEGSVWEVDVLYQGKNYAIVQDDYSTSVIKLCDVVVEERDVTEEGEDLW